MLHNVVSHSHKCAHEVAASTMHKTTLPAEVVERIVAFVVASGLSELRTHARMWQSVMVELQGKEQCQCCDEYVDEDELCSGDSKHCFHK